MTKEGIRKKLERIQDQIALLQEKERVLNEEWQQIDDAETLRIFKKQSISTELLLELNEASEKELRQFLRERKERIKNEQAKAISEGI